MRFSQDGREILKKFEGVYARVYDDLKGESEKRKGLIDCYSSKGTPTIGVGHVVKASWVDECDRFANHFRDGYDMDYIDIMNLLEEDISKKEPFLNRLLKVELSQKQYDALFLMMFQTGQNNKSFRKVIDLVNQKKWKEASDSIAGGTATAIGSGGVLKGLQKRRQEEALLFLEGSQQQINKNKIFLLSAIATIGVLLL